MTVLDNLLDKVYFTIVGIVKLLNKYSTRRLCLLQSAQSSAVAVLKKAMPVAKDTNFLKLNFGYPSLKRRPLPLGNFAIDLEEHGTLTNIQMFPISVYI